MREEVMYPVCPHRNVPAAFQRFLGPDSGGIERFFSDEPTHRTEGTLVIVARHGKRAVRGAVYGLQAVAQGVSHAVGEFNGGLWRAWAITASSLCALRRGLHEAGVLLRRSASPLFGSRLMRLPA
jgi:hypothetical protein